MSKPDEITAGMPIPRLPQPTGEKVPSLLVVGGPRTSLGRVFWIDRDVLLGRAGEADAWLDEEGVSRKHARVVRSEGGARLIDLGSKNGTWVNGARITEVELKEGDLVQIGASHILRFVFHDQFQELAHRTLLEQATRDSLTGAYNRGSFYDQLRKDLSSAIRHKQSLTLAMLDLDHFKTINDTWGHAMGDLVLRHFSRAVGTLIRSEDTFGRVGGEEFGLILRQCPADEAARVTERIRQTTRELDLMYGDTHVRVTVSIGVTTLAAGLAAADSQLIEVADRALFASKHGGRDRVTSTAL